MHFLFVLLGFDNCSLILRQQERIKAGLEPQISRHRGRSLNHFTAPRLCFVFVAAFFTHEHLEIQFDPKCNLFQIRAHKEVILSAGSIGSPHILMLSGIGNKTDLEQHGIEVKQHLSG